MLNRLAFAAARAGSWSPYGNARIPRTIASLFPKLQRWPIQTRYGRLVCDLRYQVCLDLLKYREYRYWRGDLPGFASLPIKDGTVVADIGANIGIMSRMFASRGGIVHAFEPSPSALELLEVNTADLPNVTIHRVALSDGEGTTRFNELYGNSVSSISKEGIEVPMRTLDSIGIMPTVIKIDVEGYEHRVLRGAAETIRSCRPVILFEALCETARQYCEDIIGGIDPSYRFETLPEGTNHIAWPS